MQAPKRTPWLEGVLYLAEPDPMLLVRAIARVGNLRLTSHRDVIRRRLHHPQATVRAAAAGALLNGLAQPGADRAAVDMLHADPSPVARRAAAAHLLTWATSTRGDPERARAALERATGDPDPDVAAAARRCLATLGPR